MKILHVMDKLTVDGSKIHGPARQLAYRHAFYDPERYSIRVCALRHEDPGADFLRDSGIETDCLGRSIFDLRAVADIARIIDAWSPDIVHLHGFASWPIGRVAARLKRRRIVVQEHFTQDRVPPYQHVADWMLGSVQDAAIAVSSVVADFMVASRHLRGVPVETIWNGIPVDELREASAHRDVALLDELSIPRDARVIGIVGRLAEEKGHRYFLEAAQRLSGAEQAPYFVVVGDGPLRAELEALAGQLGVAERVRFAGHRTDIARVQSIFDVAVMASTREGFGTVGIEALACGVPLVVTDLPSLRSIYIENGSALAAEPASGASLAEQLSRLLSEPETGRQLLRDAEPLLDRCRMQNVAAAYLSIYDRLAD